MNEVLRRRVYGDLIDAIAKRCPELEDAGAIRDDIERMERLAGGDERLRWQYRNRLDDLLSGELDEPLRIFINHRIEELGIITPPRSEQRDNTPRGGNAVPVPRIKASEGKLKKIANLVGEKADPVGQSLFEPADLIRERGSGNAWIELSPEDASEVFGLIAPIDGAHVADSKTTRAWAGRLPFYSSTVIVRLIDPTWSDRELVVYYLLQGGDQLFRLDGTSPPIHEVNKLDSVAIDSGNAVDYLKYFCFFVHGEEGCFYVCDEDADPMIPLAPETETQDLIKSIIKPPKAGTKNDKGQFPVNGTVFYGNTMFYSDFLVHPTGMIEMLDDEPKATDLPVRVTNKLK